MISFSSSGLAFSDLRSACASTTSLIDLDAVDLHAFIAGIFVQITDIKLRDLCEVAVLGISIFSPVRAASGFSAEILHVEIDDLRESSRNPVVLEPGYGVGLNLFRKNLFRCFLRV